LPLAGLALTWALLTTALPAHADGQAIKLTSLDWPPFSGAQLPGLGASTAVVRAALGAAATGLEVEFYPWQRAVKTGLETSGYAGYFPEYYSDELKDKCLFSEPMGASPLGFVERKDAPVTWNSLDDLAPVVIGTVNGYVNTDDFDKRAADGRIKVEAVVDDITNIRKVANERIRLAVIDRNVFEYLLASEPSLADIRARLQFNAHPLEVKKLYICFRKDPAGVAAKQRFDQGLGKIDVQAIMTDALRQANRPTH
jgi:polar amino acid transport system substrate-binding protein